MEPLASRIASALKVLNPTGVVLKQPTEATADLQALLQKVDATVSRPASETGSANAASQKIKQG